GEGKDPAGWGGRMYLEGNDVKPASISELLPFPAMLRSGIAHLRLWTDLKGGQIDAAKGSFKLDKPVLSDQNGVDTGNQLALDKLSGHFNWQKDEDGWRLAVSGLDWTPQGASWPGADLVVEVAGGDRATAGAVRAAVSYLRLEHLHMFRDVLPPGPIREAINGFAPRGAVRNAQLVYEADHQPPRWGVCADFEDVAISPWSTVPGMNHFDGRVCGNDRNGLADFALHEASLVSKALWSKPLRIGALNGEVQWSQDAEKWRFAFPTIELEGPGLQAAARGVLDVPKAPGASPFLDLRARLTDVDAITLRDYLPLASMPKRSSAWLTDAFNAGRVKSADVLFFGSLADFPFPSGQGVFQALAEVENLDLDFDPEWPHLTQLNGSVRFDGAGMFIDARSGLIGGASIQRAHAQTTDFGRDPWLTVTGQVDATIAQTMSFLAKTPLRRIPERLLSVADPQGKTDIDLKLTIPLSSGPGDVKVDGVARLKNATLDFPSLGIGLGQINGDLHFTDTTLNANDIKAFAFESPVSVDLERAGKTFRVDVRGATDIAHLSEQVPAELWRYATGSFNYHLTAEIPDAANAASDPLRVALASDLFGVDVHLPEPLGKRKAVRRAARVELAVHAGNKTPLRVTYGDDTDVQLWLKDPASGFALLGGDISIGGARRPASSEPGLRLRAKVPRFDASAWRGFLFSEGRANLAANGLFRSLILDAGQLQWKGADMGPVHLDLQGSGRQWKGAVEGQLGKGRYWIRVPEHGHPLVKLDMDMLNLSTGTFDKPYRQDGAELNPDSMPVVQVNARQTSWRGADLGELELMTERWAQGIHIKKLSLQHRNHDLQLTGTWLQTDGRDETRIDGRLSIVDMGRFLASLGYAKEIRDTATDAQFSLSWPGAPHQLSAAGVRGGVDLDLGRGSILKMEPGLGRAFAVLNLDSLRRLLMLDFSDIFGKGLAYDSMRGRFELGGGQARTNGFLIDAVAAVIMITGRVGLVQKDLDETVTVIPHAFASLPMAGAMVGGAAVGAAISMAGKLIGQDSVSIASNRYAIRGSWDSPQVSRIEGNMPLDVLDRAWSGLKNLSGFGSKGAEGSNE
ncbi:MAG: hypothetical protein H6R26_970, partial [Proteobacteria bacterium]|nr:hypothetical protein [Pseudomonadota bacterium]